MRYLDAKTSYFLSLICIILLFLPKINLISFGGRETAGIRIDDILILMFSLMLMWAHFSLNKKFYDIERVIFALVAFSLISFSLNRLFVDLGLLQVDAKIFYAVRILEYFAFFYVGLLAFRFFDLRSILTVFLVMNLGLMVMQKAGLIGEFSVEGYFPTASFRPPGISSFPSEMGLLLNMLFCFLIYTDHPWRPRWLVLLPRQLQWILCRYYPYLLFLLFGAFIVMNGSRIALAALVLSILPKIKEEFSSPSFAKLILLLLFSVSATGVIAYGVYSSGLAARSEGLLSVSNLELIGKVWDAIDINQVPIGHEAVNQGKNDASWWMRIHKWCYAFKIFYLHPFTYLQGVGPGFAMAGLDGGLLRILVEYGIVGSALFWFLFYKIYKLSRMMKWCVIVAIVNMVFFDVYLAYKPMGFLFLMTGFAYAEKNAVSTTELPPRLYNDYAMSQAKGMTSPISLL